MKKLIDKRFKLNRSIRDSFITIPDTMSPKQKRALAELKRLLKYDLGEKTDA